MILQSQLVEKVEQMKIKESTGELLENDVLDLLKTLEKLLPAKNGRKMSALEILQSAIDYIWDLSEAFHESDDWKSPTERVIQLL